MLKILSNLRSNTFEINEILNSPNFVGAEPKTVLYCPKETLKTNVSGTYSSQEHEGSSSIGFKVFWTVQHVLVPHQKDWESTALLRLQNAKVLYSPNLLALEPKTVLYCPKETLKANVSGTYSSQEHEGSSSIGFKVFLDSTARFWFRTKKIGKVQRC